MFSNRVLALVLAVLLLFCILPAGPEPIYASASAEQVEVPQQAEESASDNPNENQEQPPKPDENSAPEYTQAPDSPESHEDSSDEKPTPSPEYENNTDPSQNSDADSQDISAASEGYALVLTDESPILEKAKKDSDKIAFLSKKDIVYVSDRTFKDANNPGNDWVFCHFDSNRGVIDGYMRLRRLKFLTEEETLEFLSSFEKLEKYTTFDGHPLARIDCDFLKDAPVVQPQPTSESNAEPAGSPEPEPEPTLEPEFIQTPVPEPGPEATSGVEGSFDQEPALQSEESPPPTDGAQPSAEPDATPDGDLSLEPSATPDGEASLEPETSSYGEGPLEPETSPDAGSTLEPTETPVLIEETPATTDMPVVLLDGFMDLGDLAAITVSADTAESALVLPETLQATSSGAPVEVSVTWARADTVEWHNGGVYAFLPVLPEGYATAEGIQLPEITVVVGEAPATQIVSISIDPALASPGDTVTLTATVTGCEGASFQWQWAEIPQAAVDKAIKELGKSPTDEQLEKTSEDMAVSAQEAELLTWTNEPKAIELVYDYTATAVNLNRYWRLSIISDTGITSVTSFQSKNTSSSQSSGIELKSVNAVLVSNAYPSIMLPKLQASVALLSIFSSPAGISSGGGLTGHSWIYVQNTSDNTFYIGPYPLKPRNGVTLSVFGHWPFMPLQLGDGIYYNNEAYAVENGKYSDRASLAKTITLNDIDTINGILPKYNHYNLATSNCTNFSIAVWNSVTGIGDYYLGELIDIPSLLAVEICRHPECMTAATVNSAGISDIYKYISNIEMKCEYPVSPTLIEPQSGKTFQFDENAVFKWNETLENRFRFSLYSSAYKKYFARDVVNANSLTVPIKTETSGWWQDEDGKFCSLPLDTEGTWSWKVAAYNGKDIGTYSQFRTFNVTKPNSAPSVPNLLKPDNNVSVSVETTVNFQWKDTGAALYILTLHNDNTGENRSLRVDTNSKDVTIPSEGTWRWKVTSMANLADTLATSEERTFTATSAPVTTTPGIPVLGDPGDGKQYALGSTINFQWNNTGASKYRLTLICDTTPSATLPLDISGTSYPYTTTTAGSWRWQVQSYIGGTLGDAPHTKSFIVLPSSASPNSNVSVRAEYYAGVQLSGNVLYSENLNGIDRNWGTGTPGGSVPVDAFSAKFTATYSFSEAGWYRFHYEVDDCIKIFVHDNCVVDQWSAHVLNDYTQPVYFNEGTTTVVVHYAEINGDAKIKVTLEKATAPAITLGAPKNEAEFALGEAISFSWSGVVTPLRLYKVWLTKQDTGETYWYMASNGATTRSITPISLGRWSWRVSAMYNTINELSTSPTGYFTVSPPAPTKPDMKLSAIHSIELPGNGYFFSANLLNGTQVASGAFKVRWFVDGEKKAEYTCPGLTGNQTLEDDSYGFEWYPVLSGSYQITVDVDGAGALDETDELNNSATTAVEVSLPPPAPDFEYTFENGEAFITGYTGDDADISVPATILGAPVTRIGEEAFQDVDCIETVDLPNSIRSIEKRGFGWCSNLRDINLPEGLTAIGNEAFASTAIEELSIPRTVTSIGDNVFDQCDELRRIGVASENTSYRIVNGALLDYDSTSLLRYPPKASATSYTMPDTVTDIWSTAFLGCEKLTSITLKQGIKRIGERAFVGCNHLTSITLPVSLEEISYPYFYNCSALTAIEVNAGCENYADDQGVLIGLTQNELLCFPEAKKVSTYTVPDGVEAIGDMAFYNNQSLKRVDLSDDVRRIEGSAFLSCPLLERITISSAVESISSDAIMDCDSVTIFGEPGSAAEQYASDAGIPFVNINEAEPDPVESIRLEVDDNNLVMGGRMSIYAEVLPKNAEQTLHWASSSKSIATVSDDGTVVGVSPGTATITAAATDGSGKKASVKVYVFRPVTSITLSKSSGNMLTGKSLTLAATVKPSNATYKSIEWESSDLSVATVNSKGVVFATGVGETTITARTNFGATGDEYAEFALTVTPAVLSINLITESSYIQTGNSINVGSEVLPTNALQTLRWTSSNSKIAKVTNGTVTGVSPGKAKITAYTTDGSGKKARLTLYVYRPVTSIILNKASGNLIPGKTLTLSATVKPSKATYKSLAWESSDPDVATVSTKGVVRAISAGQATITVRTDFGATGDESAEFLLTVTQAVQSIGLTSDLSYIKVGGSVKVNVEVLPVDALQTIRWTTSKSKIAKISNGTVTGVAPGKVKITAYSVDGSGKKASINLYIYKPVTSIRLNKTSGSLATGKTLTLKATVKPSSATYKAIVWESSDIYVATVNSKGVVSAVGAGDATITARTEYGATGAERAEFNLTVTGSNPDSEVPNGVGNTSGNILNNGFVAQTGSWIYYQNTGDNGYLYKLNSSTGDKVRLNTDVTERINVLGNIIIYQNMSDSDHVYRINTDGSGRALVSSDKTDTLTVVNGWMFYRNNSDGGYLYKMRTDGSDRTRLNSDNSYAINVAGDYVYYSHDGGGFYIYRIGKDGSGRTRLNDDGSYDLNVYNGWIYYTNVSNNSTLYKINIDGTGRSQIDTDQGFGKNVNDGWIYYTNWSDGYHLYKMKLDGSSKTKLTSVVSYSPCVISDWVYYVNASDSRALYRVHKDGTGNQKVS